jgi:hypothetical protein
MIASSPFPLLWFPQWLAEDEIVQLLMQAEDLGCVQTSTNSFFEDFSAEQIETSASACAGVRVESLSPGH